MNKISEFETEEELAVLFSRYAGKCVYDECSIDCAKCCNVNRFHKCLHSAGLSPTLYSSIVMSEHNAKLPIKVKIKLEENGIMPVKKTIGAACFDCYASEDVSILSGKTGIVKLGFRVELPVGYEMLIRPRSGMSTKQFEVIEGTIDSDYRGVCGAIIHNCSEDTLFIKKGDRVAQMTVKEVPPVVLIETDTLSETARGEGGFGSTGVSK